MSNDIPSKVVEAIAHKWGITQNIAKRFSIEELVHDWVVWGPFYDDAHHSDNSCEPNTTSNASSSMDPFKTALLGASPLIVPKQGKNSFSIFSGAAVSDKTGVTYDYEITIEHCPKASREAAKIITEHISVSTVEVFKALRIAPVSLGTHFIWHPLILIRDLKRYHISVSLIRPDDKGGYRSDTVS